ncbi:hypothetical protein RO1_30620 [Roseburia intestinalis XB6B4]|uniref:Uncharacterized protein n=2 Tax=Roseburia intestinalis TaxID=166486 RepID=C7G955_9FIRM|nr:hypothetical protein ROSINTL182_06432 [Roseburia intestinalis L1-82]CBL13409.1 hypothetical protein RO1_30620 [Roseburia intestinalis XB6B4]
MISIAYGIKKTFCRSLFHPLMNPAFSTEGLLFFYTYLLCSDFI